MLCPYFIMIHVIEIVRQYKSAVSFGVIMFYAYCGSYFDLSEIRKFKWYFKVDVNIR